jgi:hypothetical protein
MNAESSTPFASTPPSCPPFEKSALRRLEEVPREGDEPQPDPSNLQEPIQRPEEASDGEPVEELPRDREDDKPDPVSNQNLPPVIRPDPGGDPEPAEDPGAERGE